MFHKKTKRIAKELKFDNEDFNRFMDCPMKEKEYMDKLAEEI